MTDKTPVRITINQAGDLRILVVKANPKKPGSLAHARYALYENGMAPNAYVAKCKAREGVSDKPRNAAADIAYDTAHGFIKLVPASELAQAGNVDDNTLQA